MLDDLKLPGSRLDAHETVAIIKYLAPVCIDSFAIEQLLENNLTHKQVSELITDLGELYPILNGSYCGRFVLDMSNPYEKLAAIKLAEINTFEIMQLKDQSQWPEWCGGTSQDGNWSQFRNAKFTGKYLGNHMTREDLRITTDADDPFFRNKLDDHPTGLLEFDFVSTERLPTLTPAMVSEEFDNLVRSCALYVSPYSNSEGIAQIAEQIMHLKKTGERRGGSKNQSTKGKASPVTTAAPTPKEQKRKIADRPGSPTAVPGGGRRRNQLMVQIARPKLSAVGGMDNFKMLGEEVKRRNLLHKLFISGRDDNFSEEQLFEWLRDKEVEVDKWSQQDRDVLHQVVKNNEVEVAATHPPVILCHGLKVRRPRTLCEQTRSHAVLCIIYYSLPSSPSYACTERALGRRT